MGVSEGKEKKKGLKRLFKEIRAKKFPNLGGKWTTESKKLKGLKFWWIERNPNQDTL